jgi:Xaa-Pro aminopeptidase
MLAKPQTGRIATEQPFDAAELAQRLTAVRAQMAEHRVDLLLVTDPHDMYYLTGGRELGGLMQMALVVPGSGEMAFAGRAVDVVAYVAHTASENVFPYRDHQPAEVAIARAIESYGIATPRIGYQGGSATLSIGLFDRLQCRLPRAMWVDTTRLVWDLAAIKSPRELEYMRQAARINTLALDRAIAAIKPGVSDNTIAAELIAGMLEAGSHPITGFQLASGPRTWVVHATYNDRKLDADDVVHFEFSATRFRYTAPLMRTVTLGKPWPAVQKLNDGALAAVEAAIATITEGVTSGEVDAAANAALERHGVRQFHYHRTGYMVGIAGASWGLGHIVSLREEDPTVLRENMTFHLPMVLFEPGVAGAGLSETVRVTRTGCDVLTSYRRELIRV